MDRYIAGLIFGTLSGTALYTVYSSFQLYKKEKILYTESFLLKEGGKYIYLHIPKKEEYLSEVKYFFGNNITTPSYYRTNIPFLEFSPLTEVKDKGEIMYRGMNDEDILKPLIPKKDVYFSGSVPWVSVEENILIDENSNTNIYFYGEYNGKKFKVEKAAYDKNKLV